MKAKLYFGALIMEIRLSDDKQFFSTEQESQKEFVKRVSDQVKTDYLEDLEITHEFDLKKTKGKVTQSLQRRLTVIPNGVEKELILEVLESRKADIDPEFSENTFGLSEEPAKNSPTPKKKPLKEEKPKEVDPDKEARKAALKAFKESKMYKEAYKNVGKKATYKIVGHEKPFKGTIKGVFIGKKMDKVYYLVVDSTGKRSSCTLENCTING